MLTNKIANLLSYAGLLAMWLVACPFSGAADMKPEDIVTKYLDSLGTAQARAAVKSRVNQGSAHFKILVGGAGYLDGKGVIVSEGRKLQLMMKFSNNDYRGEQFIFDGDKVQVAFATSRQTRSALGQFVYTQDAMVKEGLLGGEFTTAFPLLNLDERKPKLSYQGQKNIDGRPLLDILYRPKKGTDLEIHMYFEPGTYRHVMTVYSLKIRPQLGQVDPQLSNAQVADSEAVGLASPTGGLVTETNETATAHQQETRYRLEERFSDFKTVDGLTLPSHYNVHFSQELGSGRTTVNEWDISAEQVSNNVNLDPKNFQVR